LKKLQERTDLQIREPLFSVCRGAVILAKLKADREIKFYVQGRQKVEDNHSD